MRHADERRPVQFREPKAERRRMHAAKRRPVGSPEERFAVSQKKSVFRLVAKTLRHRDGFDRLVDLLHVYGDRRHWRGESRGACCQCCQYQHPISIGSGYWILDIFTLAHFEDAVLNRRVRRIDERAHLHVLERAVAYDDAVRGCRAVKDKEIPFFRVGRRKIAVNQDRLTFRSDALPLPPCRVVAGIEKFDVVSDAGTEVPRTAL